MGVKPKNDDVARELAARLADSEAACDKLGAENSALQDEIDRLRKSVEGFMAENQALKEEIAGNNAGPRKANIGSDKTSSHSQSGTRAERLTRALLEAARKGVEGHG
jgi:peptidoglycan hydrolase CwlO-like protein